MSASDKMTSARTELVLSHPFFGALALRFKMREDSTCRGSWNNGKTLGYNPKAIDTLSVPEVTGLVAEHVMHNALGHPWRRDSRMRKLWDEACDEALSAVLKEANIVCPSKKNPQPRFDGKTSEHIYSVLQQEQGPDDQSGPGDGSGDGWSELRDPDEGSAQELATDWEVATIQAANAAKAQGNLPGSLQRLVDEIKRPRVDWKAVLRKFVQEHSKADYTWKMPNPRYISRGLYLPGLRSEDMPPIVVGIDTSGSIDDETLSVFASELNSIVDECKPLTTHVVYCDCRVTHVDEFARGEALVMNPKGGGGSDMEPIFKLIEQEGIEPACCIVLTDMFVHFPEQPPDYPTLWASITRDAVGPFGETLEVEV